MKIKKIITVVLMIIVFLNVAITISNATGVDIGSGLDGIYTSDDDKIDTIGGRIIGVVSYICYGAAVIVLVYKGVQFMAKAPEAKAEAKKELVSYAIGAFILFAIGGIIRIIGSIALNDLF